MSQIITTNPVQDPITLAEAKSHLRVTASDEDALITSLITSATQQAENYTQRAILTQSWTLSLYCFPGLIALNKVPVQSITSIKYIDNDGTEKTLAASEYKIHTQNEPALLEPEFGKSWPASRSQINAVNIEYVTGWKNPVDVPWPIKSAILLMIGDLYRNREDVSPERNYELPNSSKMLLNPYKIIFF